MVLDIVLISFRIPAEFQETEKDIMATHKSALKRARQSENRRLRNRTIKSHLRARVKGVKSAVEAKDYEKAQESLLQVIPVIDKAASKGVIHKRNAARSISRLTRKVAALKS